MTPELVTVLVAVQRRAKGNREHVPLSVRYDPYEKVHGEPFPHLLARRVGTRQEVISASVARRILNDVAASADLHDAGQPITFTPHDFRRLFTTEMVSTGLPLHIAATLLGHLNLDTTRGYTAIFPEEVIAAHQHFIERRRQTRPFAELRPATGEEWTEFENHFLLRKVALGDCHRPYGTPCVHEHACTRCRFLRVDPTQLPRIEEMTSNAEARLAEAKDRALLGEVAALEESLRHLRQRRTEAEQRLSTAGSTLASN
jgi:Phage integrase family